ncbi:unnamed protein product [Chondrus crispus]|uniref:Uncharacterized protein n=1 Tax=Chondrus crispus TaxID=2769 RepID=R7Q117_CHOCR|nr:unnamed protein product [Chondrus crispus]CDF32332.1 unnamed protein product [Chondrus crispus]|eukprot:XP_005711997.1 unnamed protein product [Chondrus crispus]
MARRAALVVTGGGTWALARLKVSCKAVEHRKRGRLQKRRTPPSNSLRRSSKTVKDCGCLSWGACLGLAEVGYTEGAGDNGSERKWTWCKRTEGTPRKRLPLRREYHESLNIGRLNRIWRGVAL